HTSCYRDWSSDVCSSDLYWERDLRELVGPLMRDFDAHLPPPATVDYMSDAARYDQWGWHVDIRRATPREFSTLAGAGPRGFSLRSEERRVGKECRSAARA